MSWLLMSRDNRTSAHELLACGRWRGCASRAYYAVYCETTDLVLRHNIAMPNGWNNPKHGRWLANVVSNLPVGTLADRTHLAGLLPVLHDLRVTADYRPNVIFDDAEARQMIGLCARAHQLLARL